MKNNSFCSAVVSAIAFVSGIYFVEKYTERKIDSLQNRVNVLSDHFQLLNHWLELKNEGKNIASYFEGMSYSHIAIYGMAELANRLVEELEDSQITVDYGVDRDVSCTISRIDEIFFPDDDLPETDVIVVTPYASFDDIREMLKARVNCPIISLEEVIWSV